MTERVDVLVVGAGLAGLAAGATAARSGCDVMIVDSRVAGGRARSARRDGYVLNEGAHALYRSGPAAAVLRDLGVEVTGGSPPIERYRTWWDGELHPLPLTPTALVSTRLLGARSKVTAGRLLGRLERIARDLGPDDARITLGEWLDRAGVRPDLRKLLTVVVRLSSYS
ncbi:MAG TPA: NAD(P)-binding protein, partial [Ilumatobacteraceae bacterium]